MNEIELLKHLVRLEQQQYELKIRIDIWRKTEDVQEFEQELASVHKEITQLEESLVEVEDKKYSFNAKKTMINQLIAYETEINKARLGLKLSRNQGLTLENYLFSGILIDLHYPITNEVFGFRIPAYLHYTYSEENSVEIKDLTEFLNKEIQILRNIHDPNYIKLRQFYHAFRDRMLERFVK